MATLGYIRASHSTEGNIETQRAALAAAGADRIFEDATPPGPSRRSTAQDGGS